MVFRPILALTWQRGLILEVTGHFFGAAEMAKLLNVAGALISGFSMSFVISLLYDLLLHTAHNLESIVLLMTQDYTKVDKPLRVSEQWHYVGRAS